MSKRRTFTPGFKAEVMLEVLTGAKIIAQVNREHGIKESLVQDTRFIHMCPKIIRADKDDDQREAKLAELERMVM
jgi:transposase-like protein